MGKTNKIFFLSVVFEYNLKKGNINYFMAVNAQPTQQQGEIKFHNYLVDVIRFDAMNEKKGGKNETFIASIILDGNCFNSTFVVDVVFRTRN